MLVMVTGVPAAAPRQDENTLALASRYWPTVIWLLTERVHPVTPAVTVADSMVEPDGWKPLVLLAVMVALPRAEGANVADALPVAPAIVSGEELMVPTVGMALVAVRLTLMDWSAATS